MSATTDWYSLSCFYHSFLRSLTCISTKFSWQRVCFFRKMLGLHYCYKSVCKFPGEKQRKKYFWILLSWYFHLHSLITPFKSRPEKTVKGITAAGIYSHLLYYCLLMSSSEVISDKSRGFIKLYDREILLLLKMLDTVLSSLVYDVISVSSYSVKLLCPSHVFQ